MSCSQTTRAILQAYGYTPSTLAADLGVTYSVAKRILYGRLGLWTADYYLLKEGLHGATIAFLMGEPGPGKVRAYRERRATEQQQKEKEYA